MDSNISELRYPSATGLGNIYAKLWIPEGTPVAILQIAHGMAEHIERYAEFAEWLNQHGILVAANDHAGHGKSLSDEAHKGYFGPHNGWSSVVEDMKQLHDHVAVLYPGVSYLMLGHSMGSFLARTYAARFGDGIAAFVFSGTAGKNPAVSAGRLLAKIERKRNGPIRPSKLLNDMSFGSYNKPFAPVRTDFDWLSRDTQRVDRYVADPLCGFVFTAEAMLDLFDGLDEVGSLDWAARVPEVPILLISGERDPLGGNGKGIRQVSDWLKNTGHTVTCKLYPDGRHEMLNETNRTEVYADILSFIKNTIQ